MRWKLNCLYYREENYFAKRRQFCCSDCKIWTAPIITSWNFLKNKAVLLQWFENMNCPYYHELKLSKKWSSFVEVTWNLNYPYYHELKFSKKCGRFYEITWKFALPLSSRGQIFTKIKHICLSDLKISTALIITS